jgi:phosphatidylglycerophosphatase A
MKQIHRLIASGFGTGFLPAAPGTFGSALAAGIIWCYWSSVSSFHYSDAQLLYMLITLFFFFAGILSTHALQQDWGHDSPRFTVDEIAGMFITMLWIECTPLNLLAAFILFRFFDILKPFGIRLMEKVHGGWGVMLDDMLSGIYANLLLHVILFFGTYAF